MTAKKTDPKPSIEHLQRQANFAMRRLVDAVSEFPFEDRGSISTWASMFLTIVARAGIDGPVPIFAVTGPKGSGKTMLVDFTSLAVFGCQAERWMLGNDKETRRIVDHAIECMEPILHFEVDDLSKKKSTVLCSASTATRWIHRRPRESETTQSKNCSTIILSGLDQPRDDADADLVRRIVPIYLDGPLHEMSAMNRSVARERGAEMVQSALAVLGAHASAGRPSVDRSFGSFEEWTRQIADAIVWTGFEDPVPSIGKIAMERGATTDDLASLRARLDEMEAEREAMVAAAYEAVKVACLKAGAGLSTEYTDAHIKVARTIDSLTPASARATFDAAIERAREDGAAKERAACLHDIRERTGCSQDIEHCCNIIRARGE